MAKKTGRKTKLNLAMQDLIVVRLEHGATIKATCDSVGISTVTFHNWLNRGEAELTRRENGNVKNTTDKWQNEQPFVMFFNEVTRAQADGLIQAVLRFREGMEQSEVVSRAEETVTETRIGKDGNPYEYTKTVTKVTTTTQPGDWRAAMEYLARRDPDNWARRSQRETRQPHLPVSPYPAKAQ